MDNVLITIFARMNSTRLPGKAMLDICGKPSIQYLFERAKKSGLRVALLTADDASCDPICDLAKAQDISVVRGDETNLFDRINKAQTQLGFDHMVRVTGDDIFFDYTRVVDAAKSHIERKSDYTTCGDIPNGCEFEIVSNEYFLRIESSAKDTSESEYLTHFFSGSLTGLVPDKWKYFSNSIAPYICDFNLTLDTQEDLENLRWFVSRLEKDLTPENIYKNIASLYEECSGDFDWSDFV